ncbi:hypothetical protein [Aquimarina algicola]|uniref:Uncharacterized protein n=1 Tax=Aquimarina algicola TaxID=2589995 RepID=A0A504JMY7_9FLAO|nr:hypothetical protein [Aquimarina algicola]TPN89053.1 hypothetical protein FHK87_02205 [Aquimarina algicola]
MNTTFFNILYFVLPLVTAVLVMKFIFKLNINILLPSAIMLILFVIATICSPFTSQKFETELFVIFCVLQLLALTGGILLMSKQEILWKQFFISLPFQLFYWLQLFYYGGLQFTHKF